MKLSHQVVPEPRLTPNLVFSQWLLEPATQVIITALKELKPHEAASFCREHQLPRFESLILLGLACNSLDETIAGWVADHDQCIDLVSHTENEPSVLFQLLATHRWPLLWNLLTTDKIRSDNLGCLTRPYQDIRNTAQGLNPFEVSEPDYDANARPLILPQELWETIIIPQLDLHSQLQLRQVNRAFYQLTAPLRLFRSAYPIDFSLQLSVETRNSSNDDIGFNVDKEYADNRAREYPDPTTPYAQLTKAIDNRNLPEFIKIRDALVASGDLGVNYPFVNMDHPSDNTMSVFASICASDNLSLLCCLMTAHVSGHESPATSLLPRFACQFGALEITKFIRLADPHNELFNISEYIYLACNFQHIPVIKLIANLVDSPGKARRIFEDNISSAPVSLCLAQHNHHYNPSDILTMAIRARNIEVVAYLLAAHPPAIDRRSVHVTAMGWLHSSEGKSETLHDIIIVSGLTRPIWEPAPATLQKTHLVADLNTLISYLSTESLSDFFQSLSHYNAHLDPLLLSSLAIRAMHGINLENLKATFSQPGININKMEGIFTSPLAIAFRYDERVLACIIELGASLTSMDCVQVMREAIETGEASRIIRLLAMPNAVALLDMKHFQLFYDHPFYMACKQGELAIVEAMLTKIDTFSQLTSEESQFWFLREGPIASFSLPQNIFRKEDCLKICSLLFAKCKLFNPVDKFILYAIEIDNVSLVKHLVTLGAEPAKIYENRTSPLQCAIDHQRDACLVALLNSPEYAAQGYPNIPAALGVYRLLVTPQNDREALCPGVLAQIFLQHLGYFYELAADTEHLRKIEKLIIDKTLAPSDQTWELGFFSKTKITIDGKKYPVPAGISEIMASIIQLKKTPYPACQQLLESINTKMRDIISTHGLPKEAGLFHVATQRHVSTIEVYREIRRLMESQGMVAPSSTSIMNNNNL
jgi:hypothetical protein